SVAALSSPLVRAMCPTGLNATATAGTAPSRPAIVPSRTGCLRLVRSHSTALLSTLAVTAMRPSGGAKATADSAAANSVMVVCRAGGHGSAAAGGGEGDGRQRSGEFGHGALPACAHGLGGGPQQSRPIGAAGECRKPVWGEGHRVHRLGMPGQRCPPGWLRRV